MDRIPAKELEQLIYSRIDALLGSPQELSSAFAELALSGNELHQIIEAAQQLTAKWPKESVQESANVAQKVVVRVVVLVNRRLKSRSISTRLAVKLTGDGNEQVHRFPKNPKPGSASHGFRLTCPFQLAHRRGQLHLVLPNTSVAGEQPNHSLVRSIARSLQWKERIIAGEIYCKEQLAAEVNMNASYVGRILRLGVLSPDMVDSVTRHRAISDRSLTRRVTHLPLDWIKQKAALS